MAEFQICISVPLRLTFDHPPKRWQTGRKEGKKTEREHFKENSSYRANICIGSEYEIIVFWLKFLHNLIVFIISSSGFICFQNLGHANASQRQKINFHSRPLTLYPANICWSWRPLQDISWRRLQHVFSVTVLRLQDVLEANKTFTGNICTWQI